MLALEELPTDLPFHRSAGTHPRSAAVLGGSAVAAVLTETTRKILGGEETLTAPRHSGYVIQIMGGEEQQQTF